MRIGASTTADLPEVDHEKKDADAEGEHRASGEETKPSAETAAAAGDRGPEQAGEETQPGEGQGETAQSQHGENEGQAEGQQQSQPSAEGPEQAQSGQNEGDGQGHPGEQSS